MQKEFSKTLLQSKYIILVIVLGSVSWCLTMVKSGLPTPWGIGFWGANGHDAIWHLALSNTLGNGVLQMPVFASASLQNYHIGFDLLLALLSKTGISSSIWYFQIFPFAFSISIGALVYTFVLNWRKNKLAATWATFFVYFGSGFGYIVTLLRGQGLGGESMFWSQQSISTLINPPFALSLIILLGGLISLQKYLSSKKWQFILLTIVLFGILAEVKAYAGVLLFLSLAVLALCDFVKSRKILKNVYLVVFIFASLISFVFFKFLVPTSGNLFELQPGWFLETMLALSDRFYWPKLYEAIFNWRSGHIYEKAIVGYGTAFAIFIFGNFGARVVLLFQKKKFDNFDIILGSTLLGGIAAPMLFVQRGTAWNTIQFFYYSLFVGSIYAGIAVSQIQNKKFKFIIPILLVLFTVPTSIATLSTVYLPARPPAVLPFGEAQALNFLRSVPNGVVLTFPFDGFKAKEAEANPPRPLYLYDSTAYVSAFSNKPVFLEDEVNLNILGYNWKERRADVDNFYKSLDEVYVRNFLNKNNIKYIYWVKPQRATLGESQLGIENIFENDTAVIYSVR